MSGMFIFCTKLNSLPIISKWNKTNVTNMSKMFYSCFGLSENTEFIN